MTSSNAVREKLLDAIIPHVAFDGWSAASLAMACEEADIAPEQVRLICPRGALDLAADYHRRGDELMIAALLDDNLGELRFRDRVALAVRRRLEAVDKELVRRGTVLFALPSNAADGAQLIWGTADTIWNTLGDTSEDANWYTKRATLSAVYGSTVLFWLGDTSEDSSDSWAFLDRRIDNVMQFEKLKSGLRKLPGFGGLLSQFEHSIRRPKATMMQDVPGTWRDGEIRDR